MKTCFVIMPIGDQKHGDKFITALDLKHRYDDLITEAVKIADPETEITRADDVSMPGSITIDILMRLMHSTYIIADITFPNPNVFHELGIRHAIRNKTILIKEKSSIWNYFDISHLRYLEYENTPTGIKELANKLKDALAWIDKNPNKPDNQFLELASLTKFKYPLFFDPEEQLKLRQQALLKLITPIVANPNIFKLFADQSISKEDKNAKLMEYFAQKPEAFAELLQGYLTAGLFNVNPASSEDIK